MSLERAIRSGGSAGVASGCLSIAAALALVISMFLPVIPEFVFVTLLLCADVLIVFTLMAVYAFGIERAGPLSNNGVVLSIVGLLLGLARFFSPLGSVLFVAGLMFLAMANTRRRKLPVGATWLWFAGAA